MSHFEKAFKTTIEHEGGYSNDPDDAGGETKFGISKRAYPHLNIANLTLDEAKQIYKDAYYHKLYDALDEVIAIELFDTSVNMGQKTAKMMLQSALNLLNRNELNFKDLVVDGIIGKKTISACFAVDSKKLLKTLNGLQFCKYKEIVENDPTQEKWFNGWLSRV